VKDLLHRLKYNADTTVLPALATVISPFLENQILDCDIIVPVPLHKQRLRVRGLNQALCLARLFFPEKQELINCFVLKRGKYTLPQTGLDGRERRRNLRGAFYLSDSADIRGKHVCLVDDVYTTGTTLNECSRVVRQAGAAKITVITLARVVMGHRR
jgi:ComF family protein